MFRRFLETLVDIIYPPVCLACRSTLKDKPSIDNLVCAGCWGKIKRNLPPFCYRCGRHLDVSKSIKNICTACLKKPLHFDRAFSPCLYEGVLKDLILKFKYKNKDYLGTILGKLMIEFMQEYNFPIDVIDYIIPVPLHRARMRQREFNQAEVLGNHIGRYFNKTVLNNNLIRSRSTQTQTELEEDERFLNVQGSFSIKNLADIQGKNMLLVDDVFTTGATSSEATYTLKNAGARIVFVLTLAN